MADLTANSAIHTLGPATTQRMIMDSSAAQHVYKGQPAIIDQDVDAENVRGFVDATVVAATDVFVGIINEEKNIALGDAESVDIELLVEPTVVGFPSAVFTNADLGKTVYMSDSGTLSETAADNPEIGTLFLVRDGYAYVAIKSPKICSGA